MSDICVISIDLQNDFFDVRLPQVGRLEKALCLPGARKLIHHARLNKQQILHVVTHHTGLDTMPLHLVKAGVQPYCREDTEGAQTIDGLVDDDERRIKKMQYSGFFGTDLADHLINCVSLIVCGVAADCCVLHTALDAASHQKNVYIPYQAVSATTLDSYVFGLEVVAKSAGAVVDLEALLRQPERLWEGRLQVDEIRGLAGGWFSTQVEKLEEFRRQRPELFDVPTAPPQEMVANLESFLVARAEP